MREIAAVRDPFSSEAEQGLLGGMILDPSTIDQWADSLKPDDFYWPDHGEMFRTLVAMVSEKQPIDYITVADRIGTFGSGESALALCGDLKLGVKSSANVGAYARVIIERKLDRTLADVAEQVYDIAMSTQATEEKVAAVHAQVQRIDAGESSTEVIDLADELHSYADELERRHNLGGAFDGLETGIKDLDDRLRGLKPEEVIVVAARAKMGKTTFAMGIVRHNGIKMKKKCLVFSLEMSRTQLLDRMLSAEATVPLSSIQSGAAIGEYPDQMVVGMAKLSKMNIKVIDKPGMTIGRARTIARRHKFKHGLDLILIDHIGLLDGDDRRMDARARISDITRQAKLMAKELGIPVILVSQLNRALESRQDKRPMPSDLRESGTIEQDADMVIFVHREEYFNPDTDRKGIGEIILSISRSVEPGTFFTSYQGQYNRFVDLAKGYEVPERQEQPKQTSRSRGMSL